MKFKKTGSKSRDGYTYKFCNGDSVILTPGENDITEADIKRLHALDDAEVYNNIKNSAVPMTEREKIEKAEWDSKHQGESYPKKWNVHFENLQDGSVGLAVSEDEIEYETEEEIINRILWFLTETQRKVHKLVKIDGFIELEMSAFTEDALNELLAQNQEGEAKEDKFDVDAELAKTCFSKSGDI